ncbi:hypothetical protein LTR84_012222 [Exophiala bonariae]|uniref:Cytochrome P450 n=1 Tax=Exophiala bonariae TaxID=1690606 RepID=A0AAV9NI55_9EURO|nr:hypothetical protein LTR84_012222 [Exophiala bonariae]
MLAQTSPAIIKVDSSYIFLTLGSFFVLYCVAYISYYRYIHPLSRYPGPFVASFTNFWKVYQLWTSHLPDNLIKVHQKYGSVVRVGPNDLSFNSAEAVTQIYKAGRDMPKTGFYEGFTTFNPNLFGTRDEDIHAIRRRQLAHGFSMQSVKDMEEYIDRHIEKLLEVLEGQAKTGEAFDLKEFFAFYMLDVLGDLAFSQSFNAQVDQKPEKLPPINDHVFLACLMGMMPEMLPYLRAAAAWTPLPWLRRLFRARAQLKSLTAQCVRRRLDEKVNGRKDLLTSLINAVDPVTGAKLTEIDINTEAFAMIVAGAHTTAGTLTLLFARLLQNSEILDNVVAEIDSNIVAVPGQAIGISGLEQRIPYSTACINESFRINSVFTMTLPRSVTSPTGAEIDGHWVPKDTAVFSLNHVVHHNPALWGADTFKFDPSRFLGPEKEDSKRRLGPFGVGHRMCIGRNMAMTSILKVLTTLLKNYQLEMVDPKQKIVTANVGISEMEGPLMCLANKRH